tara:strand:- start:362 stop:487 length:126 start_codon:yes stop_codon:yes gene_type:complete
MRSLQRIRRVKRLHRKFAIKEEVGMFKRFVNWFKQKIMRQK